MTSPVQKVAAVRKCSVCGSLRVKNHLCVRRVVDGGKHFGALVVALAPSGVMIREKGRRTTFVAPYALLYQRAAADEVMRVRREKAAEKKARRKKGGRR